MSGPSDRTRPPIRTLILGVNALILLAPIVALLLLRIYQTHLLHQTEAALIAESVWIGEVYRDAWAAESGAAAGTTSPRPPGTADDFYPLSPQFDPSQIVLPRQTPPKRYVEVTDTPAFRAGARLKSLLDRAKRVTLSGARVLDERGVVVASSGAEIGAMLGTLPEVEGALAGHYTVVGRERVSDEPTPPLDGIRRRGQVRLFTAMPIHADGRVIGVVRLSRTGVDVVEALWLYRAELALALLLCVGLTLAVAYALSRFISRPVQDLMEAAKAITRGEARRPFRARGFVPAELFTLSESLDALTRQLTERAEYVAAFAAQAGHELKTPLTSIRGAVELLADDAGSPDARDGPDAPGAPAASGAMTPAERARFLRNIAADTQRMERLVFRLLELARLENAVTPPPAEAIDLRAFFGALAERHAPRLVLSIAPETPATLHIAPEHLESAVGNLVDNALRHGGETAVEVAVRPAPAPASVSIRVTDHGPGLSEKTRARLFERFFTTERGRGGTGLGLAIVAAIARTRGGRVEVESRPGETTFVLVV